MADEEQNAAERYYDVLLVRAPWEREYSSICPELGCASQGTSKDEALEMLADAMQLCLDGHEEMGVEVPRYPYDLAQEIGEAASDGSLVWTERVKPAYAPAPSTRQEGG